MYSSKLSVGIHILCVVALGTCPVTSEDIAGSIGTNPVLVRRLMARLKRAGLLNAQTRLGATGLSKPADRITLLEIFRAVETQRRLFDIHTETNADCPVGANINKILTELYGGIQRNMETRLDQVRLSDLLVRFPQARESEKTKSAAAEENLQTNKKKGFVMKIAIIGGSGMAGSAIYREAAERGHEVTAVVRDGAKAARILGNGARILAKDAFELTREDLAGFDVVVDAFSAPPAQAYLHVDLAAKLVAMFRGAERPRLFFILGAGSLLDGQGLPFVETIRKTPGADAWISIPEAQLKELQFLRGADNVNWVGVSPSAVFREGARHEPKLGSDYLLKADDGESHVTNATAAVAVLDEIEHPTRKNSRFTVSD